MRHFILIFLFVIGPCLSANANEMEIMRKSAEKMMNITIHDVYELEKTEANTIKDMLRLFNNTMIEGVKDSAISQKNLDTKIRYCFYNIDSDTIYNKLLKEYEEKKWTPDNKFYIVSAILAAEQCELISSLPQENTRQEIYNFFQESMLSELLNMSVPTHRRKETTISDYYSY